MEAAVSSTEGQSHWQGIVSQGNNNAHEGSTYDEVEVAVSIIHARDSGPELPLQEPRHGVRSGLTGVRAVDRDVRSVTSNMNEPHAPIPLLLRKGDDGKGMGCILENVVVLRLLAGDDILSLLADLDHRITEPGDTRE